MKLKLQNQTQKSNNRHGTKDTKECTACPQAMNEEG